MQHFGGENLLGSAVLSGVVSGFVPFMLQVFFLEFPNSKNYLSAKLDGAHVTRAPA